MKAWQEITNWAGAAGMLVAALTMPSCGRSAEKTATQAEPTTSVAPSPAAPLPNLVPTTTETPASLATVQEERRDLADLEQQYGQTSDPYEKMDTLRQISDWQNTAAIATLGRIFQSEASPELRCEVLGAVIGSEGNEASRLEILMAGLAPAQPLRVRQVAIAGLQAMETPEAKEVLQRMRNDTDPEIQAAAAEETGREP